MFSHIILLITVKHLKCVFGKLLSNLNILEAGVMMAASTKTHFGV